MKMNKLAAGALALALGLGAVAPAVAAETKDYTGAQLFLEKYEKELKKANEARLKYIDAQAKIDAAKKRFENAKARLEAARKAYEAQFAPYLYVEDEKAPEGRIPYGTLVKRPVDEAAHKLEGLLKADNKVNTDNKDVLNYGKTVTAETIKTWAMSVKKDEISENEITVAVNRYVNAIEKYLKDSEKDSKSATIYTEYVAAQYEYDAAKLNLKEVEDKNEEFITGYKTALKNLEDAARPYNLVVQVGNNGIQLVKPDDAKVESPKKFNIKELKAAREKALQTLEAVKLLEELAPKKIAGVKAELNKLVEEQKALIKLADKYLAKEMALVSTAYAAEDEEEMSPEELTNKLNEKSDKIQDLIKDKEEDKKPEVKPEEEKKPEDKKPEENKPAKKSGNNARTGIAGVAGVAGILAAASVAYAASKRD